MFKVLNILKTLSLLIAVYLTVFIFIAGIVYAEEVIFEWKQNESVTVNPQKVEITGLNRLTRETVLLVTGLEKEKSWFDIDERNLEKFIYSTGWVKKCTAKKTFPDSIYIVIEEFSPAIIVSSIKDDDNNKKNTYTMWFANRDGVLFKKAFPGEMDDSLPFFHIDNDIVLKNDERRSIIRNGVLISESWKKADDICTVKSIRYDSIGQYTADCVGKNDFTTVIQLGKLLKSDEIASMSKRFLDTALKLKNKNIWAGEYIFEGSGEKKRIVVGKVIKKINRGSDA